LTRQITNLFSNFEGFSDMAEEWLQIEDSQGKFVVAGFSLFSHGIAYCIKNTGDLG
jgi:hypothetical protein